MKTFILFILLYFPFIPNAIEARMGSDTSLILDSYDREHLITQPNEVPQLFTSCNCPQSGYTAYTIGTSNTTTYLSSLTLPDILYDGCLKIEGKLIIDDDQAFISSLFLMGEGAEIVVESDAYLVILYSDLFACDKMWKGINVSTSGDLWFSNNDISDAQYALTLNSLTTSRISDNDFDRNYVGITILGLVDFAQGYLPSNSFSCSSTLSDPYSGQIPDPHDFTYAGIQMEGANGYFDGEEGIHIGRIELESSGSSFNRLRNGVVALESSFHIFHAVFDDYYPVGISSPGDEGLFGALGDLIDEAAGTSTYAKDCKIFHQESTVINEAYFASISVGSPIKFINNISTETSYFYLNREGLRVSHTPNQADVIIKDNEMKLQRHGFTLSNINPTWKLRIQNNDLEINNNSIYGDATFNGNTKGIFLSNLKPVKYFIEGVISDNQLQFGVSDLLGVYVANCGNINIERNNITCGDEEMSGGTFLFLRSSAFSAINSHQISFASNKFVADPNADDLPQVRGLHLWSSYECDFCCDTIKNASIGASFLGDCMLTEFRQNSFEDSDYRGLLIGSAAYIGNQDWAGNTWKNGNAECANCLWPLSEFLINPNNTPTILNQVPSPIIPSNISSAWFVNDESDDATTCASEYDCGIENPPGVSFFTDVVDSVYYDSLYFNDVMQWEAEKRIYYKIALDELSVDTIPALDTFYAESYSGNLEKFFQIDIGIKNLYDTTSALYVQSETIDSTKQVLIDTLSVKKNLQIEADSLDSLALQIVIDSLLLELDTLLFEESLIIDSIRTIRLMNVDSLIEKNDSIVASTNYEANRKTVNDIYLRTIAKESYSFDSDLELLDSLSKLCILSDGYSILEARSLYAMATDSFLTNPDTCFSYTSRSDPQIKNIPDNRNTLDVEIYPNPATSMFFIDLKSPGEVKISILDSMGRLYKELNSGKGLISIDASNFPDGVYFCHIIRVSDSSEVIKKIILTK